MVSVGSWRTSFLHYLALLGVYGIDFSTFKCQAFVRLFSFLFLPALHSGSSADRSPRQCKPALQPRCYSPHPFFKPRVLENWLSGEPTTQPSSCAAVGAALAQAVLRSARVPAEVGASPAPGPISICDMPHALWVANYQPQLSVTHRQDKLQSP